MPMYFITLGKRYS